MNDATSQKGRDKKSFKHFSAEQILFVNEPIRIFLRSMSQNSWQEASGLGLFRNIVSDKEHFSL
jgi:hypothetical protein